MNTTRAFILATMITSTCLRGAEIKEQSVTPEELASALGVRPYCADLIVDGRSYPRLVAEVKDQNGEIWETEVVARGAPHERYRIRAFLFEDVKSRVPQRLIFNLSSGDNVAGNAFIDFPEGSRLARTSTNISGEWFYEVWIFGPNSPSDFFRVRLRIETSAKPYPLPSSHFDVHPTPAEPARGANPPPPTAPAGGSR
jgi:hypothetical protein